MDQVLDRIFGAMIGSAIGDAFGVVSEFKEPATMAKVAGSDWLDEFLPYPADWGPHPLGVWENPGRRGVATDDTRMNQLLVDVVIENNGYVNSQLLAIEHINRRLHPDRYYHARHHDLAVEQFAYHYPRACEHLGMTENAQGPVLSAGIRSATAFPILHGLINLGLAGTLYAGAPEAAYRKAVDIDPYDLAYAKDATGVLAAMVSAGVGGAGSAAEMIETGLSTNPFQAGAPFLMEDRYLVHHLRHFLSIAGEAKDKRSLMTGISRAIRPFHAFDPLDILGVPLAAFAFAGGDALLTIEIAANSRDVDEHGALVRMRDTDCAAAVGGVLAGSLHGSSAFPSEWVEDVLAANREVYRIDIEKNARDLYAAVYR